MKAYLLATLLVAALVGTASAGLNCSNPIYDSVNDNFGTMVFALTSNTQTRGICPRLEGRTSCCNSTYFEAAEREWGEFYRNYAEAQLAASAATLNTQRVLQVAVNVLITKVQESDAEQEVKDALVAALRGINGALQTFLGSFVANLVSCINVVLDYMVGIMCLACRPDWASFVTRSSVVRYILAVEVCNDLKEGCTPLLNSVSQLQVELNQTMYALNRALPSVAWDSADYENPCEDAPEPGNCESYACYRIVRGLNAEVNEVQGDASRNVARYASALLPVASRFGAEGAFDDFFVAHKEMEAATAQLRALGETAKELGSRNGANYENSYSDNGFNAVAEGKESSLDSSVSPASSMASLLALAF